ncbi:MAG: ADP-forming succinate--CoA ligase subunit beta [Planctomycetia bacterium]
MKLHEHQAKELFRRVGLATPRGELASTPKEAGAAFTRLGGKLAVVKAQVHAGGRGKGGGVKLVRSAAEAESVAAAILAKPLVTPQTGPEGVKVRKLLVEEGLDLKRQLYAAVLLDRASETPILMASAEGGMDIEEVAATKPKAILREVVDPTTGLSAFRARRMGFALGVEKDLVPALAGVLRGLAKVFIDSDASLVEVNPLVTTGDGRVVCLDGKVTLDDNALFRHKDLAAWRDVGEEDPTEVKAAEASLSYVKLHGNIGCLVNGAGLAMATMDVVKLHGGEPANFLDVGGGATEQQVTTAFRLILEDPAVKGILVNIFGGIMKCDVVAQGVVNAARAVGLKHPLVVRLEGTNVDLGRKILKESGLAITPASDMADAARKIVEAVR